MAVLPKWLFRDLHDFSLRLWNSQVYRREPRACLFDSFFQFFLLFLEWTIDLCQDEVSRLNSKRRNLSSEKNSLISNRGTKLDCCECCRRELPTQDEVMAHHCLFIIIVMLVTCMSKSVGMLSISTGISHSLSSAYLHMNSQTVLDLNWDYFCGKIAHTKTETSASSGFCATVCRKIWPQLWDLYCKKGFKRQKIQLTGVPNFVDWFVFVSTRWSTARSQNGDRRSPNDFQLRSLQCL